MNSPFFERRVLLVEDEIFVVWLVEDMLADLGCAVVGPASSVNQALAMIDAEAIDAAVLDVNLNGQMSYPIADALAARGVPFVFSTGYDKDALLDGYRTFPVLQKPIHRSELSDALAKLLTPKEPSVESAIAAMRKRRLKSRADAQLSHTSSVPDQLRQPDVPGQGHKQT
jgi:CheY-like chemotaxis protein